MFIFMLLFGFVFFQSVTHWIEMGICDAKMCCPLDKTGTNNSVHLQFTLFTECLILSCVYIAFVMKCANDFENSAILFARALTPSINRSIGETFLG